MHLLTTTTTSFLFFVSLLSFCPSILSLAQLSTSFYATTCPQGVSTITSTFLSHAKQDNVIAPSTLRLILHDCFVEGCDGSILLSSTPGNKAERDAPDNVNLPQNSFNAIIEAKKAVEQLCPGVVSCADILALAARDSVVFLGGPSYEVPLGRQDGRISTAASVNGRLPGANFDVTQLADNFASVGLNLDDMVVLSGAHTIGFSHCDQFRNRLYSFNSTLKVDPSMNPSFVQLLQNKCPASGNDNLLPFDFTSPFTFDNNYYQDLEAGKGLLFSDQVLFQNPLTKATVQSLAGSQSLFFAKFSNAMIKMCAVGVKQGGRGEVRKDCTKVNTGGGGGTTPAAPIISSSPPIIHAPLPPPSAPNIPASKSPLLPPSLPPPAPHIPLPPPLAPRLLPPSPLLSPPPPQEDFPPPPPPPPPSGGFTIPGIPGFIPPIHVPLPPIFGRIPSPPSGGSSPAGSSTKHG